MNTNLLLGIAARVFGVITLSVGAGFIAGAIAFLKIGQPGAMYGGPFGHIADVIGWGTGFLTASVATFAMILLGRNDRPGLKPEMPRTRGLE